MGGSLLGILASIIQLLVGSVLAYAGVAKLSDPARTRAAIIDYQLIPPQFAKFTALGVAWGELAVGLMLILGTPIAVPLAIFLVFSFSAVVCTALIRKLSINCGCFRSEERISKWTLVRSATLIVILSAAFIATPPHSSMLMPTVLSSPFVHMTSVGVTLALVALAIAVNTAVTMIAVARRAR